MFVIDIDYLKQFNDTYGHQAGDRCLKLVANELKQVLKRPADMIARIGGEEFAVILPHTDGEMALRVAERIRRAVKEFEFLADEHPTRLTVSAGVATYTSAAEIDSMDALVRAADHALYEAKDRGRDCVVRFGFAKP